MAFKPPVAVYDSCVLYPFEVRNLLVQFAFDRLVEPRWTDEIHDEWIRNLVANTPGLTRSRLEQTRDLMKQAVPSADVTGYQQHVPTITLPDPDDRHVVAAGIAGGASIIVTWNLKDFPAIELSRHGLKAQSPDALARRLYTADPTLVVASVKRARANLQKSKPSAAQYLHILGQRNLAGFAAALQKHLRQI
ncbi:MAG: PIN domain-containing protein [Dongiaceae bacterium]